MAIFDTWENNTLNAQFAQVATLVPIERVRVGKTYSDNMHPAFRLSRNWLGWEHTSDANVQLTGPNEKEKNMVVMNIIAIPARCAA